MGCESSVATDGIPDLLAAYGAGATGHPSGADAILTLRGPFRDSQGTGQAFAVFRLSDGASIAAARIREPSCGATGVMVEGSSVFDVFNAKTGEVLFGAVSDPGIVSWDSAWRSVPARLALGLHSEGRWAVMGTDGKLSSGEIGTSAQHGSAGGATYSGAIAKQHALWSVFGSGVFVRDLANGDQSILMKDDRLLTIGASDSRVVWVASTGPRAYEGTYESVVWGTAGLKFEGSSTVQLVGSTEGEPIKANSGLLSVIAGKTVAATVGCDNTTGTPLCSLFVLEYASGSTFELKPPEGRSYSRVLTVTDDLVVAADNPSPLELGREHLIDRLLRIRIGSIVE